MENRKVSRLFSVALIAAASSSAFAQKTDGSDKLDPRRTPHLMQILGAETYMPVEMTKLANPVFVYVNLDLARADGYEATSKSLTPNGLIQLRNDVGYAVPAYAENSNDYLSEKVFAQATGNGGIGLNDNLGDGRSMGVIKGYRAKGGGRTGYVGPNADVYHSSGGLPLSDAVREAVWSNLLSKELPYGAHSALTIFATGTLTTANQKDFTARAILIAEDPHRFGHSVINETAEKLGGEYAERDRARIKANMRTIVEALPKPEGISLKGLSRAEIFRLSVLEAIDRQAIQHGYLWAHRLFHGATSPANASPDGRLLDFGTMISLRGYGRVQVLDDDGASGETRVFKKDLIKDIRDSWIKTLPAELLAALPSESELFKRFDKTFAATQRSELVRNAGAIDAIFADLKKRPETKALGETLFKLAIFQNEKVEAIWLDRDSAIRNNGYDIEKIVTALSQAELNSKAALNNAVAQLVPEAGLRAELVDRYQSVFKIQQGLASAHGVTPKAEAKYREAAAIIRNTPMSALFRSDESNERLDQTIRAFEQTKNQTVIQEYVDSVVETSRREFRDAEPFTFVLSEKRDAKTGLKTRRVFDAKLDRVLLITTDRTDFLKKANESALKESKPSAAPRSRGFTCRDIFG